MSSPALRLYVPGECRRQATARFPDKGIGQAHGYRGWRIWSDVRDVTWQAFVMKNCHHFTGKPQEFRAGNYGPLRAVANKGECLPKVACW